MGHQLLCKGQLIWSVWIKSLRFIIKDVLIHMLNPFRGGSDRSWHVSWIHNNSQTTLTYYWNRLLSLYVYPHRINWNWKCYVPLWCTPNSLALSNQVCEAITNQSYECRWILKWGVGLVGVSDRVFLLGVLASWEQCSITGSLIIDVFFGFAVMSQWMREQSPGRSNKKLCFVCSARRKPSYHKKTRHQVKAARVASLSNSLRGWNLGCIQAGWVI